MKRARVSDRQVLNRARAESASILRGLECEDLEFLGEECNVHLANDDSQIQEADASSNSLHQDLHNTSDNASVQLSQLNNNVLNDTQLSEISVVFTKPTKLSEVFSDYESSASDSCDDESEFVSQVRLRRRLQEWYVQCNVNLSQLQALLEILRIEHPDLPKDARTIVRTPRSAPETEKNLANGSYIHVGLESGLLLRLQSGFKNENVRELKVDVNMDGLNLSDSSNLHAWPILGRCNDLVDDQPFSIGIFVGKGAPQPIEDYLEDYISEVKRIQCAGGITFNGVAYLVTIRCYILDTPGRAHIKRIKGHSGTQSCERCIQEGESFGHYFCYETVVSALRTDEAFARMEYEEHQNGESPLLQLGAKLVSEVVLDPMHLLFIGVTRRFMKYLIGVKQCKTGAKLTADQINDISAVLLCMKEFITSDFARIPRSLQFLSRWKATELRLFLLYVGIVALKGNVKTEVYQLFSLLFVASRIIASKELSLDSQLLDYAEKLLCSFVKHSADNSVLGPTFVTINVHNLLHLVDDVRKFGSINEFDAFPFENHLRIIRGMMRSGVKVARQMVNRLSERDLCYKASILKESKLTPLQYDRVANEYACLSSSSFTVSAVKKRDSYFFTDHSICHLRKITKRGDSVTIVADCCDDTQSFFTYPTDSRLVGVFKINRQQTRKKVEMCIDDIKGKVMVLPHGDERIAIKLVHTI